MATVNRKLSVVRKCNALFNPNYVNVNGRQKFFMRIHRRIVEFIISKNHH